MNLYLVSYIILVVVCTSTSLFRPKFGLYLFYFLAVVSIHFQPLIDTDFRGINWNNVNVSRLSTEFTWLLGLLIFTVFQRQHLIKNPLSNMMMRVFLILFALSSLATTCISDYKLQSFYGFAFLFLTGYLFYGLVNTALLDNTNHLTEGLLLWLMFPQVICAICIFLYYSIGELGQNFGFVRGLQVFHLSQWSLGVIFPIYSYYSFFKLRNRSEIHWLVFKTLYFLLIIYSESRTMITVFLICEILSQNQKKHLSKVTTLISVCTILILFFNNPFDSITINRINERFDIFAEDKRLLLWQNAISKVTIFGYGITNYTHYDEYGFSTAHNLLINVLFEQGVIGCLLFCVILFLFKFELLQKRRKKELLVSVLSMLPYMTGGGFINIAGFYSPLAIISLVIVFSFINKGGVSNIKCMRYNA